MSDHSHTQNSKNLIWSIIINIFIVIFEIVLGILSGSIALITDAAHNITDIASMVLSLWGEKLALKPQTEKKTYGYKRAEPLIAFTNAGILLGVVAFILVESSIRLFNPEPVSGITMMIVAGVALLGNGFATYLLQKGTEDNLNMKSAWLHSLQDALFSLGVLVTALIIYFTGLFWLDSLAAIIISLLIIRKIFSILSETVSMLMDSVPKDIDFKKLKSALMEIKGIENIHDLHIWQTDSKNRFLSAHLEIEEMKQEKRDELLCLIQQRLKEKFNISHTTVQMVSAADLAKFKNKCNHCN